MRFSKSIFLVVFLFSQLSFAAGSLELVSTGTVKQITFKLGVEESDFKCLVNNTGFGASEESCILELDVYKLQEEIKGLKIDRIIDVNFQTSEGNRPNLSSLSDTISVYIKENKVLVEIYDFLYEGPVDKSDLFKEISTTPISLQYVTK